MLEGVPPSEGVGKRVESQTTIGVPHPRARASLHRDGGAPELPPVIMKRESAANAGDKKKPRSVACVAGLKVVKDDPRRKPQGHRCDYRRAREAEQPPFGGRYLASGLGAAEPRIKGKKSPAEAGQIEASMCREPTLRHPNSRRRIWFPR